ncbi:phospholipase carboxylesterase family protein [Ophiostoma piceae UAMH 11346]|uniref:Phospholipase carboxylesterase family protein n=1 Tax=Ophiostoma piceae (strain UAMH 11346) TaxID=1262450 RepID=S3BTI9_OPHP1|nr:phospholipase carboxylesterase family protein [Ophiostoma piceae UAMH 11346]
MATESTERREGFGLIHIVEPQAGHAHTHTAILLHGRGSTGEEFAEELFGTELSDAQVPTLNDRLPTWRWVFPSSPSTWNATFEEWMPAWFEAHSLTDPSLRQDLQQPGLQASVRHVEEIVAKETQILRDCGYENAKARLVLGGISLGGAVALWTLLGTTKPEQPWGGFAVASSWLPFVKQIETYLIDPVTDPERGAAGVQDDHIFFVQSMLLPLRHHLQHQKQGRQEASVLATPVFLGHGRDDAYVDIDLGRQVHQLLMGLGFNVIDWREYDGAEQEGHWIKEPEEMDDLAQFLETVARRAQ